MDAATGRTEDKNIPDKMRRRGGGAIVQDSGMEGGGRYLGRMLDQDRKVQRRKNVQRRD